MMRTKVLIGFAVCMLTTFCTAVHAQEAFLKKGTLALDPTDSRTLFLYVPGYTLLYDLGKKKNIRSLKFGTTESYQAVTTQDGIKVLIRTKDIRRDVDEINEKYNFLVNRRMPLCETREECRTIWNDFNEVGDEGSHWSALWPRTAGRFLGSEKNGVRSVEVSVGGTWEKGFIPTKRNRLPVEDAGFITMLNRMHPLYRFDQLPSQNLDSPCGHVRSQTNKVNLMKNIELYSKISLSAGLGVAGDNFLKKIPKNFLSTVLSFLGVSAAISVDAFVDGSWKKKTTQEATNTIEYGAPNEEWRVKTVSIMRRREPVVSDSSYAPYEPFGSALIRTVLKCDAGQASDMKYASFLLSRNPESVEEVPAPAVIRMDSGTVQRLQLPNRELDKGLVSINTQRSHGELVDFFLAEGVPKSIANLFITAINVPSHEGSTGDTPCRLVHQDRALGRSRGWVSNKIKIHLKTDFDSLPVTFALI